MKTLRKLTLTVSATLGIAGLAAAPCGAIDYQPFDWVPLPPGTNVVMGYYEYGKHDAYNNTLTGTITENTTLDSNIGIARYLRYADADHLIFGHQWDFNVLVPFGSLSNGKIDGYHLGNASGVGDPIVTAGFWFINDPDKGRWLSAADYVTIPIGSYERYKPLNLGGNRWVNDLQADFTQVFLNKWTIDVSADWIYYGDNTEAGATGNQRLSQEASYGAWAWLGYDLSDAVRRVLPSSSHSTLAIGYAGTFGGAQKLDNGTTGAKTEEQQIRLTYMMFLTQTWQGLISVSHDVHVAGQFDQQFGLTLRIAKLF